MNNLICHVRALSRNSRAAIMALMIIPFGIQNTLCEKGLWNTATSAGSSLLSTIQNVYYHWWLVLLAIAVIAYAVLHDDKKKAAAKYAAWTIIGCYVLLKLIGDGGDDNVFKQTIDQIVEWFGGSNTSSTTTPDPGAVA